MRGQPFKAAKRRDKISLGKYFKINGFVTTLKTKPQVVSLILSTACQPHLDRTRTLAFTFQPRERNRRVEISLFNHMHVFLVRYIKQLCLG